MKKKNLLAFFLSCLSICLVSCNGNSNNVKEDIDINSEHIEVELCENVYIDAGITPYDKYKDGISAYYMDSYIDTTDDVDEESIDENGKFFKQSMHNVLDTIEDNIDGEFEWDRREIIYSDIYMEYEIKIPYTDKEGNEKIFSYIWSVRETGDIGSPEVYLRNWDKEGEEAVEGNGMEHNLGSAVNDYVIDSEGQNLTFEKAEVIGARYKDVIERIMGEKVSDRYMCIAVNQDNILAVADKSGIDEYRDIKLDDEFYRCVYYREIDGLQMKVLDCDMAWDGEGELASGVENQIWGESICARNEWPLVVDVDKDGIRFLELNAFTDVAGVYKEKQQVIDVNQLVEKVKEYFSVSYQVNEITIYNMELCYGAYFSEEKDGPIRNIEQPFWIVDYYIEGKQVGESAMRLIYDAYTGEFMRTNTVK